MFALARPRMQSMVRPMGHDSNLALCCLFMPSLSTIPGSHFPLGATAHDDGSVNFAVVSQDAEKVFLCLFCDPENPNRETHRMPLPGKHRDIHFGRFNEIPPGSTYGFRAAGPWTPKSSHYFNETKLLLDPYARHIVGPSRYFASMRGMRSDGDPCLADSSFHAPRCAVPTMDFYDWEEDAPPKIPMTESAICELHVKGFSKLNPEIPEELRGTYAGLAHPASTGYLKELGITSVQLLPVHQHLDDSFLLEKGLVNYWGYNTIGFFAPEARYASTADPVREFRDMVKALHRAGLEVILDVVYNHTGEAGLEGPTCLLRGFDNRCYYHTSAEHPEFYEDFTGCGNSVDVSHPRSLRLVLDSMRYWVEEMHVDGFRFDLAVELGRNPKKFRRRAAFFQAIHQDPVLSQVKLIAEPWDLGPDGYQIGNFPNDWCELNGKFRDDVRRFWRGDADVMGNFAKRITGSEQLFSHNRRTAAASVNFITSHDGFTLNDLVSYNEKHNLANGEDNRDGDSHNLSSNHGVEGPTDDPEINELRARQVRNFLTTLILSKGVPFLLAGDERRRTQQGNNNTYCQDNELNWISWEETSAGKSTREFVRRLFQIRRESPSLRWDSFFTGAPDEETGLPDVCWLRPDGEMKASADWNGKKPGAFSMLIPGDSGEPALLFCFNSRSEDKEFTLPKLSEGKWSLVLDTNSEGAAPRTIDDDSRTTLVAKSCQVWKEDGQN